MARPLLPGGPLKDLNDALHELLRRAGGPSVRTLEADIRQQRLLLDGSASHTRIYDVFTRDRLPDCDLLLCMVQVIAERARRHDVSVSPDEEGERFYQLWRDADDDDRQQENSVRPVWPVYLVAETTASVAGALTALNESIAELCAEIASNPAVADKTRFCLIRFSASAEVVLPLSDVSEIAVAPQLMAEGGTARYSPVFDLLRETIDRDAASLLSAGYKSFRPAVFFLSASTPDDPGGWGGAYKRIIDTSWRYRPNIFSFGFGDADRDTIQSVATVRAFLGSEANLASVLLEQAQSLVRSIAQSGTSNGSGGRARVVMPDELGYTIVDVGYV